MADDEYLIDAMRAFASSDAMKRVKDASKDLPAAGCEGSVIGIIIGAWLSRGASPALVKSCLGLVVDATAQQLQDLLNRYPDADA